jgi:hypothetical protein
MTTKLEKLQDIEDYIKGQNGGGVRMKITGNTPISDLMQHSSIDETSDDELMHWKYIKKEKVKGKWKYYYDYKSLKKDVKATLKSVGKKSNKVVVSGKKILSKYVNKPVKSTVSKITSGTKNVVESVKKRVFKYIAKIPIGDTYRYFYSEKAYKNYLNGKNAVGKVLNKILNVTPSDTAKANAKSIVSQTLSGKFGQAIYNLAAPALVALQVELTTPKSFSELKKNDRKESNDEHQKKINPKFDSSTYDYSMNCSFCTAAYDLRKRGYDVEANPISIVEAYTIDDICSWYKGAKKVSNNDVRNAHEVTIKSRKDVLSKKDLLLNSLESNGEGARGHLGLYWTGGGGHDVIWEIEHGEAVIRDCQTGKVVDISEYLSYASGYDYVRVDNLEPTEEILRTVRNRKTR